MAVITVKIPDNQVQRVKAAVLGQRMRNPIGLPPDFDPAKFTNADALAFVQQQLEDFVRGLVTSHERETAIQTAAAAVDASGVIG